MGIDVYLRPNNKIVDDNQLYSSGYYIRESYHGSPYPSKYLFKECFENEDSTYCYDSKTLESRFIETLNLALIRIKNNYIESSIEDIMHSLEQYADFIKTIKTYEEQNIKCEVYISW